MRALLLLLSVYWLSSVSSGAVADAEHWTYDKFIAEVESGSVKSVSLERFSQISGTYIVDGTERQFRSYADTGSANDILLTRLLKQKNVAVTLKEHKERTMFSEYLLMGVLLFLLPLVTLILAIRINEKLNRLSK
jgi:ATP-dependent Zn protease